MTLGVRQITIKPSCGATSVTNYPISAAPTATPTCVINPQVGAAETAGGTDTVGRPMYPSLYITDLDVPPGNTNELAGDWQYGGTGIPPDAVFGTWKGAVKTIDQTVTPNIVNVTPDSDPPTNPNWNLGTCGPPDPVPAPTPVPEAYSAECRWNASNLGLISGHHYRVYFIVHDGDQNQSGGDCGQANWYFTMP